MHSPLTTLSATRLSKSTAGQAAGPCGLGVRTTVDASLVPDRACCTIEDGGRRVNVDNFLMIGQYSTEQ